MGALIRLGRSTSQPFKASQERSQTEGLVADSRLTAQPEPRSLAVPGNPSASKGYTLDCTCGLYLIGPSKVRLLPLDQTPRPNRSKGRVPVTVGHRDPAIVDRLRAVTQTVCLPLPLISQVV